MTRFLLLTAQRRDEVASLTFGDIADDVWRQTDNKSSRPHAVVLGLLARALVGDGVSEALVFRGRYSGKFSGFSKAKRELMGPAASPLAAARSAPHGGEPAGGIGHSGERCRGDPESCGSGRRWRLSALRSRSRKTQGDARMGSRIAPHRRRGCDRGRRKADCLNAMQPGGFLIQPHQGFDFVGCGTPGGRVPFGAACETG